MAWLLKITLIKQLTIQLWYLPTPGRGGSWSLFCFSKSMSTVQTWNVSKHWSSILRYLTFDYTMLILFLHLRNYNSMLVQLQKNFIETWSFQALNLKFLEKKPIKLAKCGTINTCIKENWAILTNCKATQMYFHFGYLCSVDSDLFLALDCDKNSKLILSYLASISWDQSEPTFIH